MSERMRGTRMRRQAVHAAPVLPVVGLACAALGWVVFGDVEEPARALRARGRLDVTPRSSPASTPPATSAVSLPTSAPRRTATPAPRREAAIREHVAALRPLCVTARERAALSAFEHAVAGREEPRGPAPPPPSVSVAPVEELVAPGPRGVVGRQLDDPDPRVRAVAARTLATAPDGATPLLDRLEVETEPVPRQALLSALARQGAPALERLTTLGFRSGWPDDLVTCVRRLCARARLPEPPGLPPAVSSRERRLALALAMGAGR